jgi:hypothetical protein
MKIKRISLEGLNLKLVKNIAALSKIFLKIKYEPLQHLSSTY